MVIRKFASIHFGFFIRIAFSINEIFVKFNQYYLIIHHPYFFKVHDYLKEQKTTYIFCSFKLFLTHFGKKDK